MKTPIYADLDQIIFENRSKEYGAYQMRRRHNQILMRASLIAFMLFIGITALPKMVTWIMPASVEENLEEPLVYETIEVPLEPIKEMPKEIEIPELEQPAAPKVDIKQVAFLEPKPTPDDQLKDIETLAEVENLDSAAIGPKNVDGIKGTPPPFTPGDDNIIVIEEPKVISLPAPDPKAFVLLEKEPNPVNLDELKNLIGYPAMAKEAEIEGKVIVRVLVDNRGDYMKHIVLKDPHPILTSAVTKQIHHLKTTPGIQAGHPIAVWVTVPFDFHLLH